MQTFRTRLSRYLREQHELHPWMAPGIAVTASAALGARLGWLLDLTGGVLR